MSFQTDWEQCLFRILIYNLVMNESYGIGSIGENAFHDFCVRQKLYWSKLLPDRTGKDCIVEWPPESNYTLDTRTAKRCCRVQVKATTVGRKSVKIKLSALEWLVKDLQPTFVIVPIINQRKSLDHFVGFHISSELLARSLEQLRKADHQNKNPAKTWMTLSLSKGEAVYTDEEMRTYLESCIGSSLTEYNQNKEEQLNTLGYDDEGPEFQATFTMGSYSEFVECLMGERTLRAEFSEPQRTRFGIKGKDAYYSKLAGKGEFSVLAEYDDTLHLHAINKDLSRVSSISMPAKKATLPSIPTEYWRAEATNGLLKFATSASSSQVTLLTEALNSESIYLDKIISSLSFWNDCIKHKELEMIFEGNSHSKYLKMSDNLDGKFDWLPDAIDLAQKAKLILGYCNVHNAEVKFPELFNRRHEIVSISQLIDIASFSALSFTLLSPRSDLEKSFQKLSENSTLLVTSPAIIGDNVVCLGIGFAVHVEMHEDKIELTPKSRFPLRGKALSADHCYEEYEKFAADLFDEISPSCLLKTPYFN